MNDLLLYTVEDRIATITMNRPEKRNAFSPELVAELHATFIRAGADQKVKIIILKASGPVFSAGADLSYLRQLSSNTFEENLADSENLRQLFSTIYHLPKVVIAQIEGPAIAGGCGLATVCDISFAVPEALFGYTEVKLGFAPAIVSCFLLRQTSETTARQLLLSAELFDARQALAYNLINYIYPKEEIEAAVKNYASKLCTETSGNSLAMTKQLIGQINNPMLEESLNQAVELNARTRESEDFKTGIAAFLQKEQHKW